jgi:hypothetical protein
LSSSAYLIEVASGRVRADLLPMVTGAHFTRDGRYLVTASQDGTALVWDVSALAARGLSARPWDDLASGDAGVAFAAVCGLVKAPRQALDLLADRLPATTPGAKQLRQWVADLGSESYPRRSQAERRLAALGEQIEEDIRAALKEKPPLERRLRLERLLKRIDDAHPATLRRGRAIEVLERIGSGEAVRLLQRLAQGHPGGRTTREAREALARLRRGTGAS